MDNVINVPQICKIVFDGHAAALIRFQLLVLEVDLVDPKYHCYEAGDDYVLRQTCIVAIVVQILELQVHEHERGHAVEHERHEHAPHELLLVVAPELV